MKKRKFYITTTFPQTLNFFAGQPRLWAEWFDVTAVSREDQGFLKRFGEREGIETRVIPMCREISLFRDVYCLFKFILLFISERPYVVHANTPKASLLAMIAAKITYRPVRIYMCHGLRYMGANGILRTILMAMEKVSCMCATEVLFVSNGIKDKMIEDGLVKKQKAKVIGCGSVGGVDLVKFDVTKIERNGREKLGIPENAFVFTFVGRVVKDKGVNELIEAFSHLNSEVSNTYLIVVGSDDANIDPVKPITKELMTSNPHIISLGRQEDVRPYMYMADAFVLPSYREGFGVVLIEAASLGTPSITSNITGCNEIIINGVNGALVNAQDSESLYNEMKLWVNSPKYVQKLASNTIRLVKDRYEQKMVWINYLEHYKQYLN